METKDWLIVLGVIIQYGAIIFAMGRWKGSIETLIQNLSKRLDEFDKKYGDLPERVAFLEGCRQKDK